MAVQEGLWLSLILAIFMVHVNRSDGLKTFTNAGNTQLLFVNEPKNFDKAMQFCNEMDSMLIEFWYEREWDEVGIKKKLSDDL